ncbi:MAG: hypothetical protein GMKNLPBB_00637 [Myxococcota bacterium]|nr:hypothetical protein [Myxococcota bacterium]
MIRLVRQLFLIALACLPPAAALAQSVTPSLLAAPRPCMEGGECPVTELNKAVPGTGVFSAPQNELERQVREEHPPFTQDGKIAVYLYVRTGCDHCESMKQWIKTHLEPSKDIEIRQFNIPDNLHAMERLKRISDMRGQAASVPTVKIGDWVSTGFIPELTPRRILSAADDLRIGGTGNGRALAIITSGQCARHDTQCIQAEIAAANIAAMKVEPEDVIVSGLTRCSWWLLVFIIALPFAMVGRARVFLMTLFIYLTAWSIIRLYLAGEFDAIWVARVEKYLRWSSMGAGLFTAWLINDILSRAVQFRFDPDVDGSVLPPERLFSRIGKGSLITLSALLLTASSATSLLLCSAGGMIDSPTGWVPAHPGMAAFLLLLPELIATALHLGFAHKMALDFVPARIIRGIAGVALLISGVAYPVTILLQLN